MERTLSIQRKPCTSARTSSLQLVQYCCHRPSVARKVQRKSDPSPKNVSAPSAVMSPNENVKRQGALKACRLFVIHHHPWLRCHVRKGSDFVIRTTSASQSIGHIRVVVNDPRGHAIAQHCCEYLAHYGLLQYSRSKPPT